MNTSYKVKLWEVRSNKSVARPGKPSKVISYTVRWTVGGREKSQTFGKSAQAKNFLSDLRQAAKAGEAFDMDSGLPLSMLKAATARTWLEFARAYVDARWPHAAAKSREGLTDTMTAVTATLVKDAPNRPAPEVLRLLLRTYVFVPESRRPDLDPDLGKALSWLEAASLPITDLDDPKLARTALEVLAVTLEGKPAAPSTFRRKRAVFKHALGYAVEVGDLQSNPLDRVKWRPPKQGGTVDRRVVVNPSQARELLVAVTYVGRVRGPRLRAMFACMYFAGLRPAEAAGLRVQDCALPEEGWGVITVRKTRPQTNKRYTDTGRAHDERGLKHREDDVDRPVPAPPELVKILREHIDAFGTADDGRLFVTSTGGDFSGSAYAQIWKRARLLALTPDQVGSPLAARPYDLRHAAVSLWLNAGVHAPEAAERAGHGVDVMLRVYAKCIDGQRDVANQRIEDALAA
ncbi:tyrosine-type recombinase/integrase [Actinomadura macrotermitis]|uniref:Tyrosine recombinase XerC n=1 Tax=Actinomadura macrotermitis TaxID=2585200 RepID=A0A7K0BZ85_9ACTN|nr:Tyrosine recombinase XerC [Actinomadura macrotermitis]